MRESVRHGLSSRRLSDVSGLCHGFEIGLAAAVGMDRRSGRSAVADALAPLGRVLFLTQVHGVRVAAAPWEATPEADAAIACELGDIVAVETADCVPILLVDGEARLVAAVHAGWRGSAAGIVGQALGALAARGAEPAHITAAIGPCIGSCCYEVGDELRDRFGPEAASFLRVGRNGRAHLDLRGLNQHQLEVGGVPRARIDHVARCTACDPARLPSFRRDGPDCGRIVSYVGWGRALA
jgi:YfiH family protein